MFKDDGDDDFFGGTSHQKSQFATYLEFLDYDFAASFTFMRHNNHEDELRFVESNLHFIRKFKIKHCIEKKIETGRIFITVPEQNIFGGLGFSKEPRESRVVVKKQYVAEPDVSLGSTPGVVFVEMRALLQLNTFMTCKSICPLFAKRLWHNAVDFANAEGPDKAGHHFVFAMPFAGVSVMEWLLAKECKTRPKVAVPADIDPSQPSSWVIHSGGGKFLAESPYPSDVLLFNSILKGILFQVYMAIAQAQRYCCFCHNDLHAGNVLLSSLFHNKLWVTGFGAFKIIQPLITIIDFQHSSLHQIDSKGELVGLTSGFTTSTVNAFSMHYDVWRFTTMLTLACLRDVWSAVHDETKAFLWKIGQFPGTPGTWPTWSNQYQWTPFMHQGFTAEECLYDSYFDSFRAEPFSFADTIVVESPNDGYSNDAATERYERRYTLCASPIDVRAACHGNETKPLLKGRLWGRNLHGSIRGRISVMKKTHPASSVNGFLFMTAFNVLQACQYGYDIIDEDAADSVKSAGLDALMVVLHGNWSYTDRFNTDVYPNETSYYKRSRELCNNEDVLNFKKVWPQPLGAVAQSICDLARRAQEGCEEEYLRLLWGVLA